MSDTYSSGYINNLLLLVTTTPNVSLFFYCCLSVCLGQTMSVHIPVSLIIMFFLRLCFSVHSIEPFVTDFPICKFTCFNPFFTQLSGLLVYVTFLLFVTSLYLFVFLCISGLSVLVQRVCVSLSGIPDCQCSQ